jgi:3' terminal RNA ribose 2'-O-methyltransferase Hen1
MLLTISTTYQPATDLGYLLYKHPGRMQTFALNFGQAHVFYPEASSERCTAALLLEIDPITLVRGRHSRGNLSFALEQYVNDRPYVASSFMSVAIAQVFGSALAGKCKERPDLANTPLPLTARLSALPCKDGADFLRRLFEPLGYTVALEQSMLDANFPEWGSSQVFGVELQAVTRLKELLTHLYVLIPVLDGDKHYYVGNDEVAKLLARGEGWLAQHPERDQIVARYLRHRRSLALAALAQLQDDAAATQDETQADENEETLERSLGLHAQRLSVVVDTLKASGANRILDLGCGEGKLLRLLLPVPQFSEVVGMDVSVRSIERAEDRMQLEHLPDSQRKKLRLIQGSLLYRDQRLKGFEAAALVEVIEHLSLDRLAVIEQVLFGYTRPRTVVITTPNQEYNSQWSSLPAGCFRHPDHHFEWTRAEFQHWAFEVAERFGYRVRFQEIGPQHPEVGAPTQMGVFQQ